MTTLKLTPLCESSICRLCGVDNIVGTNIFETIPGSENGMECTLQSIINKYLPLKLANREMLPKTICPECYNDLVSTAKFIDKVRRGQEALRIMWHRERKLRNAIKTTEEEESELSDGIYQEKKKQPKRKTENLRQIDEIQHAYPSEDELGERRRIKPTKFFEGAMVGRELDRVLLEEGAIHPDELSEEEEQTETNADVDLIGVAIQPDGTAKTITMNEKKKKRRFSYPCALCSCQVDSIKKLQIHMSFHEKKGDVLQCSCFETFKSKSALFEHQKSTLHTGDSLIRLGEEAKDEEFERISDERTSKSEEVSMHCAECDRSFNSASSYRYHTDAVHGCGTVYKCMTCSKEFKQQFLLRRHFKIHSCERPFECPKCQKTFRSKLAAIDHCKTKEEKERESQFACKICDAKFKYKAHLEKHSILHLDVKPYACDTCGQRFTQKGNLTIHLRIHTGEKPYQCNFCSQSFVTSSACRSHARRHTNERMYKCTFCPKAFNHQPTWKTHLRRHTGERPYVCKFCKQGFPELWALTKHTRIHTGEKPYECTECGKKFADRSNCSKHVQLVHRKSEGDTSASKKAGPSNDASPLDKDEVQFLTKAGNPVTLPMEDGRFLELLSVETNTGTLKARTNEGWMITLQLPPGGDLGDDDLLEQIREVVKSHVDQTPCTRW